MKAIEKKKLLMATKKQDPLLIPKELLGNPTTGAPKTELGRSAKEQEVKTINGRIQPPVLNKRPDVHPDTVGKALAVSLTSAKVAQKYDHHVQMLKLQLEMNKQQQEGAPKPNTGVQPAGSVPGAVAPGSPMGRDNMPKKLRQPPPVATVD